MSNLFSVFDPVAMLGLSVNWLSSVLVISFLPCSFWLCSTCIKATITSVTQYLHSEFKAITGPSAAPGLTFIPVSLFIFIMLNNFWGLFPFIFTSSSHLTFTLSMAFPLWLGHMIMGWLKTPQSMLAHLVPLGTPVALMPLMVIIELVSNVIRPLTLSVRLAANMVAGHLLLTLLGNQGPASAWMLSIFLMIAIVMLAILETAVSLIQAYVFSVLSTLYFNEVNNLTLSNS